MKYIICNLLLFFTFQFVSAQEAPSWLEFETNQELGKSSTVPDYSYAGYHFSEKSLPDISGWTHFNVEDYGAIPNDELYDDEAIQATINAAEASGAPAVVFFPAGKFVVSNDNSVANFIQISRDSIVLKGSGSEAGGTEIFMDERRVQNGHWQFVFEPAATTVTTITTIEAPVSRGDFSVLVNNSSQLEIGKTIHIYHKSEAFARAHFGDLPLSDTWTRLFGSGQGMTVYEPHIISAINGNRVTFKNPVQADLPKLATTFVVRELTTIGEVGVEDILFTSDWENYGEPFVHHKNDIHDYAWNAVEFKNVKNSWVRNCEFRSWSQVINVEQSIGVTIENIKITGEKGHASVITKRSFGLLVKDSEDLTGQHHGPGTGYQAVNTVYQRFEMQKDQSVDSHSGQPYATLLDDVQGGDFDQNGGPIESYPHHGQHLTFWNFRHSSTSGKTYDFWPSGRNGFTYAYPLFVGFQSDTDITFLNEGLNELEDQMVEPRSLFDAQLNLRLSRAATLPEVSFITPGNGEKNEKGSDIFVQVSANDANGEIADVKLYVNDQLLREDTEAPYEWGTDAEQDPFLFDVSAGIYNLKVIATDNDGNQATDSIQIVVGSIPTINFTEPVLNAVVDASEPVMVEANAGDEDGTVESVALFLDDVLVRTITAAPYIWGTDVTLDPTLFGVESGEHILKLFVKDDDGIEATVSRTIIANNLPGVSFTTPANNQLFEFGSDIKINVEATDTDGEIANVELFINNRFHREEITAPYDWGERSDADGILFNMEAGNYEFKVVAYDNIGSSSSSTINIVIEAEEEEILSSKASEIGKVSFYPNPFHDHFVMISDNETISDVQLYDIYGRNLSNSVSVDYSAETTTLFAKDLSSGVFLLQFKLGDSSKVIRIIKQ